MTTAVPLTEEERGRVVRMTVDVLDLIMAEASRRDGITDNEANVRLLERRKEAENRLDVGLALDIADRLGEDVLRKAMEEYTPPSVRASLDALMKREGGMLPLVKNRIGRLRADEDSTGCALGSIALIAGACMDAVLGGFTAVVGIVTMASCC